MLHEERHGRLLAAMGERGWDTLVVFGNAWWSDHLRYATDFAAVEGDAAAVLRRDGTIALTVAAPGEAARARAERPGLAVSWAPDPAAAVAARLAEGGLGTVAAAPREILPFGLRDAGLIDASAVTEPIIMSKRGAEHDALRRGGEIADSGYRVFMEACRVGRREYEIVADVEAYYRSIGCPENFMILGSGNREMRGMHPPSTRALGAGELVTTELTPAVDGYYVQICRTLVVGEPSEAQRRAFDVFIEATEAGLATVRAGVTAADIARAENDVFRAHGLGEYTTSAYTRVRGHGLGLYVDGKPALLEDVDTPIVEGAVIIVHPNTYHPDVGYMVLGDTVLVTEDGYENLITTPRRLLSVPAR